MEGHGYPPHMVNPHDLWLKSSGDRSGQHQVCVTEDALGERKCRNWSSRRGSWAGEVCKQARRSAKFVYAVNQYPSTVRVLHQRIRFMLSTVDGPGVKLLCFREAGSYITVWLLKVQPQLSGRGDQPRHLRHLVYNRRSPSCRFRKLKVQLARALTRSLSKPSCPRSRKTQRPFH